MKYIVNLYCIQSLFCQVFLFRRVWIKLPRSRQYGIVGASGRGYVTTFSGRLLPGGSKKDLPSGKNCDLIISFKKL